MGCFCTSKYRQRSLDFLRLYHHIGQDVCRHFCSYQFHLGKTDFQEAKMFQPEH